MKKIFLLLVFMMIGFPAWASNFHFESEDGKFSTNLGWRAQLRFANPGDEDLRTPSHFSDDETSDFFSKDTPSTKGISGYDKARKLIANLYSSDNSALPSASYNFK